MSELGESAVFPLTHPGRMENTKKFKTAKGIKSNILECRFCPFLSFHSFFHFFLLLFLVFNLRFRCNHHYLQVVDGSFPTFPFVCVRWVPTKNQSKQRTNNIDHPHGQEACRWSCGCEAGCGIDGGLQGSEGWRIRRGPLGSRCAESRCQQCKCPCSLQS